jgi:hypothetical protein
MRRSESGGMAGTTETAPGQEAIQVPMSSSSAMPVPMICSGQASSPNGIAINARSANGMIRKVTSGKASRLAKTP